MLPRRRPPKAGALTLPTTDQRAQQVVMGGIVPRGKLLVLRHLRPYRRELLSRDNGRHLADDYPLTGVAAGIVRWAAPNWGQRGVALLRGPCSGAPDAECTRVHGIGENIP